MSYPLVSSENMVVGRTRQRPNLKPISCHFGTKLCSFLIDVLTDLFYPLSMSFLLIKKLISLIFAVGWFVVYVDLTFVQYNYYVHLTTWPMVLIVTCSNKLVYG
jgi:hypothetical protein